jgi:integrase
MKTQYGEVDWKGGRFVARHVIARPKVRRAIPMPWTRLPAVAEEQGHRAKFLPLAQQRSRELGKLARKLRDKRFPPDAVANALIALAEHAPETAAHAKAVKVATQTVAATRVVHAAPSKLRADITVREFGEMLTDGRLYTMFDFPSRYVMGERSRKNTASALRLHVYPEFGDLPLLALAPSAVDAVNEWYRVIKTKAPSATYASRIRDHFLALLSYAYYPCKIVPAPLYPAEARRFTERGKPRKYELVRPRDEAAMMACESIPLIWRLYWGSLAREGARGTEWGSMRWTQLDFVHGIVSLDPNITKTDRDSDSWDLDPGVARALELYRDHFAPQGSPYVFGLDESNTPAPERGRRSDAKQVAETRHIEQRYRDHLMLALSKDKRTRESRARLFKPDAGMRQTTRHHLRALFVMSSYCAGRSTEWICCRTGHKQEGTVARYKQRIASWKAFGTLAPLDQAIPELRRVRPIKRAKHRSA